MPMDFKAATDALFAKLGPEALADELGCSPQSVRQARMGQGIAGHRSPPPGWERAARKLAERQAAYFRKLADKLEG